MSLEICSALSFHTLPTPIAWAIHNFFLLFLVSSGQYINLVCGGGGGGDSIIEITRAIELEHGTTATTATTRKSFWKWEWVCVVHLIITKRCQFFSFSFSPPPPPPPPNSEAGWLPRDRRAAKDSNWLTWPSQKFRGSSWALKRASALANDDDDDGGGDGAYLLAYLPACLLAWLADIMCQDLLTLTLLTVTISLASTQCDSLLVLSVIITPGFTTIFLC